MTPMSLLTGNPGVMVTLALLIIGGLVSTVVAIVMARQGLSVRPMLWFAVIFGLIVTPQFVYQLHVALQKASAPQSNVKSDATIIAAFDDDRETEAAGIGYLALSGLASTASGNTDTGFTATRATGPALAFDMM